MLITNTRTGLQVELRRSLPTDDAYVIRSALFNIRRGRAYNRIPETVFHNTVGRQFRALWSDPDRIRVVACLPEDRDFIVGFVLGDPAVPLVDIVKTRQSFTGQGVATLLLNILGIRQDTPARITFETPDYDRRTSWALLEGLR